MQHRRNISGIPHFGVVRPQPTAMDISPPQQVQAVAQPPVPPQPQRVPDFVLYVHPQCPRSGELLELLYEHPLSQILTQNVEDIPNKPPWLDGVPTLADTKIGLVYKGSDAMTFVKNLIGLQIKHREKQEQFMRLQQQQQQQMLQPQEQRSQYEGQRKTPRDMNQQLALRRFPDVIKEAPTVQEKKETKKSPMDDLFQPDDSPGMLSGSTSISLPDNSHRYQTSSKVSESSLTDYQNRRQAQIKNRK